MTESLGSKYKVPTTLRPLLEAFARETLRSQPADLIEFGCTFFEALQTTQKSNPKADVIGEEKLYSQFRGNLQQKLANHGSTSDFNQQNLNKENSNMQQTNAGSSHNSRSASPTEVAATKIQAAYRGHFVRNHPEKFGIDTVDMSRRRSNDHMLDNKKDLKRHSVGGYSLEMSNSPDDRAATKIQAEIRGFLARKHVEAIKQKNSDAATKIQAHIRGFLTRKKLEGANSPRGSLHSTKSEDLLR